MTFSFLRATLCRKRGDGFENSEYGILRCICRITCPMCLDQCSYGRYFLYNANLWCIICTWSVGRKMGQYLYFGIFAHWRNGCAGIFRISGRFWYLAGRNRRIFNRIFILRADFLADHRHIPRKKEPFAHYGSSPCRMLSFWHSVVCLGLCPGDFLHKRAVHLCSALHYPGYFEAFPCFFPYPKIKPFCIA